MFTRVVIFVVIGKYSFSHSYHYCLQSKVQAQQAHTHSGQAFKPVRGGVRRGGNQIIHLLFYAVRPMKHSSRGYYIMTTINPMEDGREPK